MENKEKRKTPYILKTLNPQRLLGKRKSSNQIDPTSTSANAPFAQAIGNDAALPASSLSAQPQESLGRFKSAWEEAVARLKKDYPNEFDLDDSDPRLVIAEVLEIVKDRQKENKEKRWKHRKGNGEVVVLRSATDKILKNLNKLAPIATAAFQYGPQTAPVMWTSLRAILKVALNETEIMQNLLQEIEYISSILGRCCTYEALYKDSKLESARRLIYCLPDLYTGVLVYLLSSQRYFSRNTTVHSINGTANPYMTMSGPLVEGIRDQEKIVETAARAASEEFLIKSMIKLGKLSSDEERFKVLTWLSDIPCEKHHLFVSNSRQLNTGNWLLEKKDFIDWKKSPTSSILWLHGIAGAGKTTLASLVIDAFWRTRSIHHAVAYFYCSHGEKERHDPVSILRAIVKQLSIMGSQDLLPQSVISIYEKRKRQGFLSRRLQLTECQELISNLSAGFGETVIIFDGLDECDKDSRKQLLDAWDKIVKSSTGIIKTFITSRDADDIVLKLEGVPNVYISSSDNSGDIAAYAIAQVQKCISERTLLKGIVDQKLQKIITEKLTNESNGMFLWVSLQIKSICEHKTPDAIERALSMLPKGLKATYSVIWDKIWEQSEENRGFAIRTLKWIMCPIRPLSVDAIVKAVSIEPTDWTGKLGYDGLSVIDLLDVCRNLVVIDEQLNVLRITHFSVNEFLRDKIKMSEAHTLAAEVCLTLMCDQNFYNSVEWIDGRNLRDYVMKFWAHHIPLSGNGRSNLFSMLKTFLSPSQAYYAWLGEARETTWLGTPFHSEAQLTPLWISCYYQLWDITIDLLSRDDVDCNVRNIHGIMPLHLAAMHGNDVIVKLLVENHAVDLNSKDNHNRSALWHASSEGQTAVVKLLLEKGAIELSSKAISDTPFLNSVGFSFKKPAHRPSPPLAAYRHCGLTALSVAALWGHEEVVKLLLHMKGVDLNFKDNVGQTALSVAALYGHDRVVMVLLHTKGVDLNSKDSIGQTPLLCAALQGRDAVVRLLLATEGVDSKCKDSSGRTLLWCAARGGNETIIKLSLATEGVDLNAADNNGITPLLATRDGRKTNDAALKLLLTTEGVNPNCKDIFGRTLLWHTAETGNEIGTKLLLATKGVDLNAADNKGVTPLLAAAMNGRDAVVKLLLAKDGIDLNARDNQGRTPLLAAGWEWRITRTNLVPVKGPKDPRGDALFGGADSIGKRAVVKLLLATKGVDPNCKDNSGRTLLWYTAQSGNETAVKLLLAMESVDLNATDNDGKTPLLAAASNGQDAVIKLLLAKDRIDLDARDNQGMTPLLAAASNGKDTVVKLLLEKDGIDLNAKDKQGMTPLLAAASEGKSAIVKLLLDTEGVDSNCKDYSNRTLLWHAARGGNETAVKHSLAMEDIDLNAADHEGITPLLAAASEGKDAIVELLLDTEGVDSNCKDDSGRTLLWYTARSGNKTAVRLLLAMEGVDLNAKDNEGKTPLLAAASNGQDAVVKLLLAKDGIDLNAKDNQGNTPLLAAASRRKTSLIELLLDTNGVDPNCKNNSGRTLLWYAAQSRSAIALRLSLAIKGVDLNAADDEGITPLLAAVSNWIVDINLVKLLLATEGVDSNCRDNSGRTLLWHTARNGNETAVELALTLEGVDLNAADDGGVTPLLAAASNGRTGAVELLLTKDGIDINAKDSEGNTPLLVAASNGDHRVVKALLTAEGVDLECRDNQGRTPLDIAQLRQHKEVIALLTMRSQQRQERQESILSTSEQLSAGNNFTEVLLRKRLISNTFF